MYLGGRGRRSAVFSVREERLDTTLGQDFSHDPQALVVRLRDRFFRDDGDRRVHVSVAEHVVDERGDWDRDIVDSHAPLSG